MFKILGTVSQNIGKGNTVMLKDWWGRVPVVHKQTTCSLPHKWSHVSTGSHGNTYSIWHIRGVKEPSTVSKEVKKLFL